jgi:hypothetical protein
MRGKVVLELEEYEDLVHKNSEQIDFIIESTTKLNKLKKEINKLLIISKVKYLGGSTEFYTDTKIANMIEYLKKDFIKNTTMFQFRKLKREVKK